MNDILYNTSRKSTFPWYSLNEMNLCRKILISFHFACHIVLLLFCQFRKFSIKWALLHISKYIHTYIFFPSTASTLFFSAHTFGILMSDLYIRHIYMKWLQMKIQMVLICWQDMQNVEVFITDSIKRNIATEFGIKMFCDSSDNRFILIWSDIDVCWWNCISFLTWWKHVLHKYIHTISLSL